MEQYVIQALLGLVFTALVWFWRDSLSRSRELEKKVHEISRECPGIQECEKIFAKSFIRDIETILDEKLGQHFDRFELRLINEGRLEPQRKKRKGIEK